MNYIGAFVKIGIPIIGSFVIGFFTFLGVYIRVKYKKTNDEKQRQHEKEKMTIAHQNKMEEMILDNFLKDYDFSNFNIKKLEELKITMSMLLSDKKNNEKEKIVPDVLLKLKEIKEKNNQLNGSDNKNTVNDISLNEVADFKNKNKEF